MTVFKRGDSACYIIEFMLDGQRFKRSSGTTNKRAAEAAEAAWKAELRGDGKSSGLPPMTIHEACAKYFQSVTLPNGANNLKHTTRSTETELERITMFFGANTQISAIGPTEISNFKTELLKTVKPSTVDRRLGRLRTVLITAKTEWGTLAEVPPIKLFRLNNDRIRYLVGDDVTYEKIWLELQAMAWNDPELRERLARVNAEWRAVLTDAFEQARREYGIEMPLEALVSLVLTFNVGVMVERLGGIETGHQALLDWIDEWLSR